MVAVDSSATYLRQVLITIGAAVLDALWLANWADAGSGHPLFMVLLGPFGVGALVTELFGWEALPGLVLGAIAGYREHDSVLGHGFLFSMTQLAALLLLYWARKQFDRQTVGWQSVRRWSKVFFALSGSTVLSTLAYLGLLGIDTFTERSLLVPVLASLLGLAPAFFVKSQVGRARLNRAVQTGREELQAITRMLPDAIFLQHIDGTYLTCFTGQVGDAFSLDSDPGFPPITVPEDPGYLRAQQEIIKEAWKQRRLVCKRLAVSLENRRHYFDVRAFPYRDEQCLVMVRDVTREEEETRERLEIEANGMRVLKALQVSAFTLNEEGRVTRVIARSEQSKGSPGEELGARYTDFLSKTSREDFVSILKQVLQSQQAAQLEVGYSDIETGVRHAELRLLPYGEDGVLAVCNDITYEHAVRQEAQQTDQLLRVVSQNVGDVVSLIDGAGQFLFVTPSSQTVLGYTPAELTDESLQTILDPVDYARFKSSMARYFVGRNLQPHRFETRCRRKQGEYRWVEAEIRPVLQGGTVTHVVAVLRDVTERKAASTRAQLSSMMVSSMQESVLVSDVEGSVVQVNPAFLRMMGYAEQEVQGRRTDTLLDRQFNSRALLLERDKALAEENHWQGELFCRRKNGSIFLVWSSCSVIRDEADKPMYYLSLFTDLSEEKNREELIWRLSTHDPITGLPNHSLFNEMVEHACVQARKKEQRLVVLNADLTGLRPLRANMGQDRVDDLLREVTRRLAEVSESFDGVARLHGDSFGFLKENVSSAAEAGSLASRILKAFETPLSLGGDRVHLEVNVGIATYPDDATEVGPLLACSTTAVVEATSAGPSAYRFFSSKRAREAVEQLRLQQEFRVALERRAFDLNYQPKICLKTGKILGFEALSRWNHPELGEISPGVFIPLAEANGLIVPFGQQTLRRAIEDVARWRKAGARPSPVAVNLSLHQTHNVYLPSLIGALLEEFELEPSMLEMEITETSIMADVPRSVDVLKKIRDLGVRLALDDFGLGYSNLANLWQLPLNTVKIDKSFTDKVTTKEGFAMCKAAIDLAKSLGLQTVAEGVETEEQRKHLQELGCDAFQGFLFAPALSHGEVHALLT